ncbi:MAG: LPXTG cell wall anchor domain-containing protein [Oenococcus sp.]|uniref:LPXTG cell wall anchor domain-containing protein n=1 Tax=Oenococcus TaxID=46254 RepID=UPI0021E82664|nr:LPXTG cell wall anchor domain-containing protein [Oenococcus kitaharae]MCV3296085.1 LPXTG cell wall anchor domain-containing protein [Oenococcus kitaharae]
MSKNHNNLIAAGIGFALAGGLSWLLAKKIKNNNADQVLDQVKQSLSAQGTVSHAWINGQRTGSDDYDVKAVYMGGAWITSNAGETKKIDFIANADTSEILYVKNAND